MTQKTPWLNLREQSRRTNQSRKETTEDSNACLLRSEVKKMKAQWINVHTVSEDELTETLHVRKDEKKGKTLFLPGKL